MSLGGSNPLPSANFASSGGVTERPKVRHWKCRAWVIPVPWVQIPPPPPMFMYRSTLFGMVVLDGEVAVPCNPQSAIAGLNSLLEGRLC